MWLQAEPPANRYSYLGIRFTGSQSCRDSCAYHRSLTRNEKNAREDGLKTHEMKRVSHFFLEYYDHANRITCVCVHVCVCWRCVCVRVRACARMCVRRWAQLPSLVNVWRNFLKMWNIESRCENVPWNAEIWLRSTCSVMDPCVVDFPTTCACALSVYEMKILWAYSFATLNVCNSFYFVFSFVVIILCNQYLASSAQDLRSSVFCFHIAHIWTFTLKYFSYRYQYQDCKTWTRRNLTIPTSKRACKKSVGDWV